MHAAQVRRMLVGGASVLGAYALAEADLASVRTADVARVAAGVVLPGDDEATLPGSKAGSDGPVEALFVQIGADGNSAPMCVAFEVQAEDGSRRPPSALSPTRVDLKTVNLGGHVRTVGAYVPLDFELNLTADEAYVLQIFSRRRPGGRTGWKDVEAEADIPAGNL